MAVTWYELVKSEDVKRHVIHELADGTVLRYQSVRGACSFPGESAGSFVILGMEMDDKLETAPPPLVLLDEGLIEGISVDAFWSQVTDAVVAACASPLYLDLEDEPAMSAFYDFKSRNNVNVDIAQAPWVDRFRLGLGTCMDWLKEGRLDLHKDSLTRKELRSVERESLTDKPEQRFPLVNALRHCLSGFRKYAPTRPFEPGKYAGSGVQHGWMV